MIMEKAQVGVTLTAIEAHLAGNLRFAVIRGKAPVLVLDISCTDDNIPGNLDKMPVIAGMRADYPPNGLT